MEEQKIGIKLKELRLARDLKQYQVAEALELSRATISNIEGGRRSLTLNTLKKFADFYKIDISYFEIDGQKDEMIDLLERTKKIFESQSVSVSEKEDLYLTISQLYLNIKKQSSKLVSFIFF
jgi:transcriptional regulator with XRE-family HTH domain